MLTINDLLEKGWRRWDSKKDENGDILLLCPLVDFVNVADGTIMESIGGEKVVKGKDLIDDDTRCGLMAYGVRVKPD